MNDLVKINADGQPTASSRDIAEHFGKDHKHVEVGTVKWFLRELISSGKRVSKADPITFWCSILGVITGNVAIFLQLWRLFR